MQAGHGPVRATLNKLHPSSILIGQQGHDKPGAYPGSRSVEATLTPTSYTFQREGEFSTFFTNNPAESCR